MQYTNGLSEYEILRLQNIQRNNEKLKKLGLKETKVEMQKQIKQQTRKRKQSTIKRKKEIKAKGPLRTSKRLKNVPAKDYKEDTIRIIGNDNFSDYSIESEYDSDDNGGDTSDYSDDSIPYPIKRRRRTNGKKEKSTTKEDKSTAAPTVATENDVIKIENAKTGRSRCRKCMEQIEKDELRVGMKAWIMGRNSVTWQHPTCFLHNIKMDIASNSRTKCKFSSIPFNVGDLRIGFRSHTATSWVSLDHATTLLHPLSEFVSKMPNKNWYEELDGYTNKLSEKEQKEIKKMFDNIKEKKSSSTFKSRKNSKITAAAALKTEKVKKETKKVENSSSKEQPKVGAKTLTKGNVAWKFGGHICFGILIASRETKTHCYARTHKGNIKTLTKGKDYWWMK
eukprot:g1483.t1